MRHSHTRRRGHPSHVMTASTLFDHPEVSSFDTNAAILHNGSAALINTLFARLSHGLPIVLGIYGASVAQNAGCLDQGNRRCMAYSGTRYGFLPWPKPAWRTFKGWGVRLLDHINKSYPSTNHAINNSGLDASPVAVGAECLFSYLPSTMHLIVIEFGSMALWDEKSLWSLEAVVRQFSALPSRPTIILLSIFNLCVGVRPPILPKSDKRAGKYQSSWDALQIESLRLCSTYGAICISQKHGLLPLVLSGRLNHSDVIPQDCLHPINAPYGVDVVTSMLATWFDNAQRSYGSEERNPLPARRLLPPALWAENNRTVIRSCYAFSTSSGRWIRELGLRLRPMQWSTTWCPANFTESYKDKGDSHACQPIENDESRLACPADVDRKQEVFAALMAQPPKTFFYCRTALASNVAQRKRSFGVVALTPGATLRFGIDSGAGHTRLMLTLTYLTSYSGGMGMAALRCSRCRCDTTIIDAHNPRINASVFASTAVHVFESNRPGCAAELRVLERTSSGGNKFKVRFVRFEVAGERERRSRTVPLRRL